MSDRPLKVFMVFTEGCGTDFDLAQHVSRALKDHNIQVTSQLDPGCFPKGEPVFGNIIKHIDENDITLALLSEESYNNKWICFETILSAEKSIKKGKMLLRVLVKELEDGDIDKLMTGLLEKVPLMKFDSNAADWGQKLVEFVSKEVDIGDLLPVGCLAHGQIFSHFTGFLGHVLPGFREWILKETKKIGIPQDKVSRKYFILLPSTCNLEDPLECREDTNGVTIERVSVNKISSMDYAGKHREFPLHLYKISKGNETYYFVADFPKVLDAIYKLKAKNLAEVDVKYQVARFYFTLNELINHTQNRHFNETVEILTYNDDKRTRSSVIFNEVKKSVKSEHGYLQPVAQENLPRSTLRLVSTDARPYDAYVTGFDDTKSLHMAERLESFLKEAGKTVQRRAPNIPQLRQFEQANWIIFIISKEFLEDALSVLSCRSVLSACINENCLRILPVLLDGVGAGDLPQYMKFITYISEREPKYLNHLLQKMNGDPVTMCQKLPCGDVATGLAWAYVINYLGITLQKDLRTRIKEFLQQNNIEIGCFVKLYLIAPKSCAVPDNVEKAANEGSKNSQIEPLGILESVTVDGRPYNLHMYKHTDLRTNRCICFVAECIAAFGCLHEMAHHYPFAGLGKEEMYKQAENFVSLTKDILGREVVKREFGDLTSIVEFIHFDDRDQSLMSAIEQHLEDLAPIEYAQNVASQGDPNYRLPSFAQEPVQMDVD